jgi:hypothetical protein
LQQSIPQNLGTTPPPSADQLAAPVIAVNPDEMPQQLKTLDALQERAMKLELHLADMNEQVGQLSMRRDQASDADRPVLDKQVAAAKHDMAAASIELSSLQRKITQLERSLSPQTAITLQPPPAPSSSELDGEQIMQLAGGGAILMIPIVLVLARNLWVRGTRKTATVDIESSPRLERIEQAIESIAVEVERIGESQRFSTKLLSERQPEAMVNRAAASARRESGTVTPH